MSETKQKLTKVLNDLIANRKNLVGQMDAQKQQREVNESQLDHFDTVIATLKVALNDQSGVAITAIELEALTPTLLEEIAPPLDVAGDAPAVAGQASAEVVEGTDANGSPV